MNADLVYPVLDLLSQRLAGDGQSEDPGVINWFYGLGLGATLAALFEEKFLEVTGVQVNNWCCIINNLNLLKFEFLHIRQF